MGKAMAKSDVIYGEQRPVLIKSFGEADVKNMTDIIRGKIGPKPVISLIGMRDAIRKAQADPVLKAGRVKVGMIDGDLIWRVKEGNFSGPKELDAIVVKNYGTQLDKYREELQEVANAKAKERLEAEALKKQQSVKKPVLVKAPSRSSLTRSDKGKEEDEEEGEDNGLTDSQHMAIFRARKAGGMAKAMVDLNSKGKPKKDGWTKFNLGDVSREDAEAALKAAEPGSWIVRKASTGKVVVSYLLGGKAVHAEIDKSIANGGGPGEKSLDESKGIRSTTVLKRLLGAGQFRAAMDKVKAMQGFFANLDGKSAEQKLAGTVIGAWLVRESASQPGVVTWTRRTADGQAVKSFLHTRILKLTDQQEFMEYAQGANRRLQVRA